MVTVNLHGYLGKKLGSYWNLQVDTIFEIFEALEANTRCVNQYFSNFNKVFTHFVVYVDGKILPPHLLKSKILKSNSVVEIVPVVQGGWIVAIVVGVLLIILSVVLAIILSPKEPTDIKTSSTVMGSIGRNVLNRNIPVPLGYGRFRVGSAVISNDIKVLNGADASASKINSFDLLLGS